MFANTSDYYEARTITSGREKSSTTAFVSDENSRAAPSAKEREALVDVAKKFPLLMNFGVRVLINAKQLSASERRKKIILVFDPSIEELQTPEWISTLGAFASMINKSPDDDFYLCPIGYFESYVSAPAKCEYIHLRVFVLEHYQDKYRLVYTPTNLQNRAPSSASQIEREKRGEIKHTENHLSGVYKAVESDRLAEKVTSFRIESETIESSEFPRNGIKSSVQVGEPINILLLGETGVGKSTFINAYYNYLTFGSLEEAIQEPKLHGLVCSTFSFTDSQYNIKTFTVSQNVAQRNTDSSVSLMQDGVDCRANEVFKPGQSSTQHAKAYEFRHQGRLIRLIDTPGIGDSRGIEVDQANFKQTIEYLERMEHLNAVCILLKPNVKRMELQTRYCIKELFSHLNKVSIQNLVFCFTNSRGTSFRPGDTLPALQKFVAEEIEAVSRIKVPLSQDNIVCMDNEAFRYLVLAKNVKSIHERVCFNELGEHKTFAESWRISKAASEKLVNYAQTLPVLKMSEMVAYNQSRSMSLELVQKIIDVLVRLAQVRLEMQPEEADDYNLDHFINVLIESVAAVTAHLGSKAVTVFNDQFDAHLEEKINALRQSTLERDFRIVWFMQIVRDEYKLTLKELRSFGSKAFASNVDEAIREIGGLLDVVIAKLNEFSEQKALKNTQRDNSSFKTTHSDSRLAPVGYGMASSRAGASYKPGWSLKNVFYDIRLVLASISSKLLPASFLSSKSSRLSLIRALSSTMSSRPRQQLESTVAHQTTRSPLPADRNQIVASPSGSLSRHVASPTSTTLDRENPFQSQPYHFDYQIPRNSNSSSSTTPIIQKTNVSMWDNQRSQFSSVSSVKSPVLMSLPTRQFHSNSATQTARNANQMATTKMNMSTSNSRPSSRSSNRGRASPNPYAKPSFK